MRPDPFWRLLQPLLECEVSTNFAQVKFDFREISPYNMSQRRRSAEVVVLEVRRLRKAKGWTQTALAFHAGLAPSVISEIETGKREPRAGTLRKLASALGVEVRDLYPKPHTPRFEPAERVRLGDVASDRQIEYAQTELERLYQQRQAGEITANEYSMAVVDILNAMLDASGRAGQDAG